MCFATVDVEIIVVADRIIKTAIIRLRKYNTMIQNTS